GTPPALGASPMGRPLRMLKPDTAWFVTTRCDGARFLLRPDSQMNCLFGLWLGRATARFTRIELHGVVMMSNHLHILLVDRASQLSSFMEYFLGHLARAVNEHRGRSGAVFDRRFSAEPILDEDARSARLIYLVANPVDAVLVPSHEQW